MYIVSFAYEYTSGIIWLYLLGHVTIHPQVLPLSIYPSITTSFVPILILCSENVGSFVQFSGETFLYSFDSFLYVSIPQGIERQLAAQEKAPNF